MKTYIEISRLEVFAHHGVMPQEARVGNLFEVSARLCYDFSAAAASDDVASAINYAEVVELVNDVMAVPCKLLETVVLRLKEAIMARWPQITAGTVTVAKLHPPFSSTVAYAAAAIEW